MDVAALLEMRFEIFEFWELKNFLALWIYGRVKYLTDVPDIAFWTKVANISFEVDATRFSLQNVVELVLVKRRAAGECEIGVR